jgi:hypothetical protein
LFLRHGDLLRSRPSPAHAACHHVGRCGYGGRMRPTARPLQSATLAVRLSSAELLRDLGARFGGDDH